MKDYRKLERYLKALANIRRLHILAFLKKHRNATVNEIAREIGLKKQATSKHLKILSNLDIIIPSKKGLYVTHRISTHQMQPVKDVILLL